MLKYIAPVLLLLASATPAQAIGLRIAGGGEIIPFTYHDLSEYDTGAGYALRADLVWGGLSTTTLEMGYRRWTYDRIATIAPFRAYRFGLQQRIYPAAFARLPVAPYLGAGLAAVNRDRYSLNIPDADFIGVTFFAGAEIPLRSRIALDPHVRWESNFETDHGYSYLSLGICLIWRAR